MEKFEINHNKALNEGMESSERDLENNKKSFENIQGYNLEVFSSDEEMYAYMQKIRKENNTEAYGFIKNKDQRNGFYYQVGEDEGSTEFNENVDNSWHSHPDISSEVLGSEEEELPENTPEGIRELRDKFNEIYDEIDQASPHKVSLMDILNFVDHKRGKDLISMPTGLLVINSSESLKSELIKNYADKMDMYRKNLMKGCHEISLWSMYEDQLRSLIYALSEFKSLLAKLSYKKMTEENYLEILDKIGFKFEFHKV